MSDGLFNEAEQEGLMGWPHRHHQAQIDNLEKQVTWWTSTCNWWREKCQEAWQVRDCQAKYITYLEQELLKERGEL
jgi:hypothetical protein